MTTRRQFIGSALAASAALPALLRSPLAIGDTDATPRVLVDWHSHYVSRVELNFLPARKQPPQLLTGADGARVGDLVRATVTGTDGVDLIARVDGAGA